MLTNSLEFSSRSYIIAGLMIDRDEVSGCNRDPGILTSFMSRGASNLDRSATVDTNKVDQVPTIVNRNDLFHAIAASRVSHGR